MAAATLTIHRVAPAEHLRFPAIVAVLAAGVLLGSTGLLPQVDISRRLILFAFLPVILFDAAVKLDLRGLLPAARRAVLLGLPGSVLAAALLAGALLELRFPAAVAFVVAAVLAATDPISVFALLRGIPLPPYLRALLEGESLVNDGTAVVLFAVVLEVLAQGRVDWAQAGLRFAGLYAGGLGLGLVWGMFFVWLFQRLEDPPSALLASVVLAFGGYFLAELISASGVIVVVVAGVLLGSTRRVRPRAREALYRWWDYLGFLASALIFLLIGFQFHLARLPSQVGAILAVALAALLARAVAVWLFSVRLGALVRVRRSWKTLLTWGGLRGALSLALVLSLPPSFPYRERIVGITVGFVLFSMIVQGLTFRPLVGRYSLESA